MIKSGSCQLLHRICSSRPGGSGEQYGQKAATFSRAYSRSLYCFQPQGSPASSCWPVRCVSLFARTASMPAGFATTDPSQVSSLAGENSSGSWRTLCECSSVRAVARTAGMHFSRSSERQISNVPHSPSRITVGWIKEIQKIFYCALQHGDINVSKSCSRRENACRGFPAHDTLIFGMRTLTIGKKHWCVRCKMARFWRAFLVMFALCRTGKDGLLNEPFRICAASGN